MRSKFFMRKSKLAQAGMTLIEIMIVIAIIGGLMAVLGSGVVSKLGKSRVDTTKIKMKEIGKQLDMYNADCSGYPTTEQGLEVLKTSPGEACPNWGPEPYWKKDFKDSWGKEFIYESDGSSYTMKSLGADRRESGEGNDKDIDSDEI